MNVEVRYEAAWVPGLDHDIDQSTSLSVGIDWLAAVERTYPSAGAIVMNAKSMIGNHPLLRAAASRWEVLSPRSRRPSSKGPVLCVWPSSAAVIEFAEHLAFDSALCVVAGRYDIGGWVSKAQAECLVEGFESQIADATLPEVASGLDAVLEFGGHNGFLGGGEKEDAIRELRRIAALPDRPTSSDIAAYIVASGRTSASGVEQIRVWYEEICAGKRHRDYRGRVIS